MTTTIVTYEDYAQMIADDVAETERLAIMGLAYADIKEAEFNWDLFETTRAELIDTVARSPFFNRGESR